MEITKMKFILCSLCVIVIFICDIWAQEEGDVRKPPTIVESPLKELVYRDGDKVELKCVATSIPDPEYTWYYNGDPLQINIRPNLHQPDTSVGTIIFDGGASRLDEGYYQCKAKNQYGTALSDVAFLQYATLATYTDTNTRRYTVREGEPMKLNCKYLKSVPKATFSWAIISQLNDKDEKNVVLGERINMDDDGNLYFSHTTKADAQNGKLYKCNVFNPTLDLRTGGSYSTVTVQDAGDGSLNDKWPVNKYYTESPTIAIVGRELRLRCLFSGKPAPEIEWSRSDGRALPPGRNKKENSNTELVISDVQFTDEGNYKCKAVNSMGQKDQLIRVDVKSIPEFAAFKKGPSNTNGTEGNDVSFNCDAAAEPISDVQWYVNGEEYNDGDFKPRIKIENSGKTLTVSSLCKDCLDRTTDLMNVQCNASNDYGYIFADAYLNVLKPTQITVQPIGLELEYYSQVRFDCEGTTDPSTALTINWFKDEERIVYIPGRIEKEDETNSLIITTKDENDGGKSFEGIYMCRADNEYSFSNASAELTTPPEPAPVRAAFTLWWVIILIILILLIIALIIGIYCFLKWNKGENYSVDEKEREKGFDPEKDIAENAFQEFQRPQSGDFKGSQHSLAETDHVNEQFKGSTASLASTAKMENGDSQHALVKS